MLKFHVGDIKFLLPHLRFALSISLEDTSVRYAVVFNGETELGDDPEIPQEPKEKAEDANAPKLKYIIVKALKEDPLLPLDIQTLSFEAGEHHLDCKRLWRFFFFFFNGYKLKLNVLLVFSNDSLSHWGLWSEERRIWGHYHRNT